MWKLIGNNKLENSLLKTDWLYSDVIWHNLPDEASKGYIEVDRDGKSSHPVPNQFLIPMTIYRLDRQCLPIQNCPLPK